MGIIKIGKKYRKMMGDTRFQLDCFKQEMRPDQIIEMLEEWYKRNGIKLKENPNLKSWPFNLSTAYRKTLRLQAGWKDLSDPSKAAVFAHERVHYMQRSVIKNFSAKYVTSARFLLAVETQAYREEMRAWRSMGAGRGFLNGFVQDLPKRLKKSYITVPMLDFREVKKHVRKVLNDELENPT
jgi:hypothetical protein